MCPRSQPTLRIDGGHAAGAGGGHGLPIHVVLHIATGEDAGDAGVGRPSLGNDVAVRIHLDLSLEQARIGLVAVALISFGVYKIIHRPRKPESNRSFSYFLTVQTMGDGKDYQIPFKSNGSNDTFDNGDKFRLTVWTPVPAYLYIFNEGPPERNDTSFNIPSMRSFRNMSSSGPILVLCLCLFVSMFNVLVSCGLHDTLRPAFTDNRRLPPRIFTSRMKKQITYSNDKRPMDQPGGLRISKDKVRSRMDRMPRMCCSGM